MTWAHWLALAFVCFQTLVSAGFAAKGMFALAGYHLLGAALNAWVTFVVPK